jgi:hypothetical protein
MTNLKQTCLTTLVTSAPRAGVVYECKSQKYTCCKSWTPQRCSSPTTCVSSSRDQELNYHQQTSGVKPHDLPGHCSWCFLFPTLRALSTASNFTQSPICKMLTIGNLWYSFMSAQQAYRGPFRMCIILCLSSSPFEGLIKLASHVYLLQQLEPWILSLSLLVLLF